MAVLPLENRRIILTRPEGQAEDMAEGIRRLGGTAVLLPMIRILPVGDTSTLDRSLRQVDTIDAVVFTSANAVRFTMERAAAIGIPAAAWNGKEVYVVGSATAGLAQAFGLRIAVVPGIFSGAELAAHLSSLPLGGKRILFPRGNLGRHEVLEAAVSGGAEAIPVVVYRTAGPEESVGRRMRQELLEGPAPMLVLASPSAVRHTAQLFTDEERALLRERITVAAIGPTTRDAVLSLKWPVQIMPGEATGDALISAIAAYFHIPTHR